MFKSIYLIPFLVFIFINSIYTCSFAQAPQKDTLILDGNHLDLASHIYLLEDAETTAGINEMFLKFSNNDPKAQGSSFLNVGYSKSIYWIFIPIKNISQQAQELFYVAENPHINHIELYSIEQGNITQLAEAGDLMPFAHREIYHKDFVFQVFIPANSTQTLAMKIDNRGYTTMLSLDMYGPSEYNKRQQSQYLIWGLVTGILLFVALFSFFLFISLKDKIYLFYGLYVLATTLYIWSNNGLGYQYLWAESPMIASRIRLIFGTLNAMLILHNMQLFVGQNKSNSKFFTATQICKVLVFLEFSILFIPYDFTRDETLITVFLIYSDIIAIGCIFLLFAGLIEKIRQKQQVALYYLMAILLFCAGIFLIILVRLNVLAPSTITLNGFYLGALMEVTVLTYALSKRYNIYAIERKKLLKEIVEKEKQEAINLAVAKERERKRIAADMHDDLGSALSGLRLMSELSSRKNSLDELKDDTLHISKSAEELTFKMKEIVWTLDNESDNLENLLLYIQKYGNRFFMNSGIQFQMLLPLNIPYHYYSGEARRHIFLATKEIFNNALKYSEATIIVCEIHIDENLTLDISDNGKGFDVAHVHLGNGIKNIHHRMESVGGKATISITKGTHIKLVIPWQNTPNGE